MPATELFEITSIAAKDTFVVKLRNADDALLKNKSGEQLSVTVYGPGSKIYTKASAARTQRMLNRMATKQGQVKLSAEDQADESAEFLAAVTVSFDGWAYKGATDAAAILAAYKDASIGFIADQVQKAVGDWANFSTSGIPS